MNDNSEFEEFEEFENPGEFGGISPTTLADLLGRGQVMDIGVRPLWPSVPRVAGPAFTVRCPPGDNLMLHAAVHRAEPGAVIVVESGDVDYALAAWERLRRRPTPGNRGVRDRRRDP